jgi:RimJ/RimL family protein N-acetyltransferase
LDFLNAGETAYFSGERVDLVAMERDDVSLVASWINDERISFFNGARFPVSLAEQANWYESTLKDRSKQKLVIRNKEGEKVGLVSLFHMDHVNQNAEIGIYVAPAFQRRGYAREALVLLMRFAFHGLNMHRLYCTILAFNVTSVKLFESVGFRREGVRREHSFSGGRFHDVLSLSLLRGELP